MKPTYDRGIGRLLCFTAIRLNLGRVFLRRLRAKGEYFPAFRISYGRVIV